MKKIIVALVVGLSLLAPATAQAAVPSYTSDEKAFVRLVKKFAPAIGYGASARQLVELGHSICEALDEGVSQYMAVDTGMDAGFSQKQAIVLVSASIVALCPWNE